jgi:hypothetical protein
MSLPACHFGRSPRLTRAELDVAEAEQSDIIARLRDDGAHRIVDRLLRCQDARLARRACATTWPWRCGLGGCWACRRVAMRRWWCGIWQWAACHEISVTLLALPMHSASEGLLNGIVRLRRRLRDARDKAVRRDSHWSQVAVAGIASGTGSALLLVQHPRVTRRKIADAICTRWGGSVLACAQPIYPTWVMPPKQVVELALARRGIEPLRIVVMPQRAVSKAIVPRSEIEPMPLLL